MSALYAMSASNSAPLQYEESPHTAVVMPYNSSRRNVGVREFIGAGACAVASCSVFVCGSAP